jgi:threonine synthase
MLACSNCHAPYPETGLPYLCPRCGGLFDYDQPLRIDLTRVATNQPGMWRYRHAFELFDGAPVLSLGEGGTPLIWQEYKGRKIGLKLESMNPSGSYKDRGTAVLISQLMSRGMQSAVEDSSGNAGASFAAYMARAGLRGKVFVPESASGPKRRQIEQYGAELMRIPGPRSAAAAAVLKAVEGGEVYASHAFMPFGLPGIATVAYELFEQYGGLPGTVVAPAGHGGLLLGLMRGFAALRQSGAIDKEPFYVGVQAAECAPMYKAYRDGLDAMGQAAEGATIAEGVRVSKPSRAKAILTELMPDKGIILAAAEETILPATRDLASRGHYVEPTSSIVWAVLDQLIGTKPKVPEPIILILSGSGLKYYPIQS